MSWQPEELAQHMTSLLHVVPGGVTTTAAAAPASLLQTGWSTEHQVAQLRAVYGANRVSGDEGDDFLDDNDSNCHSNNRHYYHTFKHQCQCCWTWIQPVGEALLGQLKEPLIVMLLGSAAISILLGNIADATSIAVALFIVASVAAVQEYRSERALEQLQHLVPHTCTVLRAGRVRDHAPAAQLVVGDLILLQTGDRVPADCRVVDALELELDESTLTGEQHAVTKTGRGLFGTTSSSPSSSTLQSSQQQAPPPLTEQTNMVFAGTLVNNGRGRAVVVAVGKRTEFGKVAAELQSVTARKSPMQLKIDELSQRLAYLSTLAIVAIAILGWSLGRPFLETVTVAVSLAVAAIPEGLPICVTVTLALGVLRMARRQAIVKKLPVVESLGCATAVASDKTGTLTQNESTLLHVLLLFLILLDALLLAAID